MSELVLIFMGGVVLYLAASASLVAASKGALAFSAFFNAASRVIFARRKGKGSLNN